MRNNQSKPWGDDAAYLYVVERYAHTKEKEFPNRMNVMLILIYTREPFVCRNMILNTP